MTRLSWFTALRMGGASAMMLDQVLSFDSQPVQPPRKGRRMPTLERTGKKAMLNYHRQLPYHLLRCNERLSVGNANNGKHQLAARSLAIA